MSMSKESPKSLSNYYIEGRIGEFVPLTDIKTGEDYICFRLERQKLECSRYHCSVCSGWSIEGDIPIEYLDTQYRRDLKNGDEVVYYDDENIYHEGEANEILANLLRSGKYRVGLLSTPLERFQKNLSDN